MELAIKRYPITVEMYHLMAERGVFAPDERLELFEGEIIEMSPIGSLHARCVKFLSSYLFELLTGKFIVGVQDPIVLDDLTEPQPDISVLHYKEDFYKNAHPRASNVALIIEVSDTTIEYDRSKKFPKYAAAGIAEAWLINLQAERIEVHSIPKDTGYGMVKIYQRGEDVISETMRDINLAVNDVLG